MPLTHPRGITTAVSASSTETQQASGDWLLSALPVRGSAQKNIHHITSYALAALTPVALLSSGALTTACDYTLALVIPVHFHIGMRSVIVDYVHGLRTPGLQSGALAALGVVTVLTTIGLFKFNITDVGITRGVKSLWAKPAAKEAEKA